MSDALCGPSNALQTFQKHASVDRTLQQDRLSARQSPSQGFRNQNPNTGALDPEFAAFESSLANAPLRDIQHPAHFAAPAPQFPLSGPAEATNWATDFQRLNIVGPPPLLHQQPNVSHAPLSSASQQGWHNEFLQHQQHQQQPAAQQQQHHPLAHTQGFQPSFAPMYQMHGTSTYAPQATTAPQTTSAAGAAFDESAFEAAFAQASAAIVSQETETATATETLEEATAAAEEQTQQSPAPLEASEQIRIGSDTIPQSDKTNDPQTQAHDADALARTAGQLVDSLKHDTSQKFRDSNFLALMRRIRDREVHIQGDEFQETSQTLHPGGRYYPEGYQQRSHLGQTADTQGSGGQGAGSSGLTTDTTHQSSSNGPVQPAHAAEGGVPVSRTSGDSGLLSDTWNHGDRWA
ncbi:protein pex20 [Aspergillus homomorphus CBS 101889]|uniref:Peroxin 20 n=1 Tax=Aspergillus homomorphus (strain CBS 101889) TaxID=1450537 RepID=A0A395I8P7_ASPHC|nr:hypothetical protein BO97DRAFT_383284 [Aspergillus homomorphus CBS 101889]RAL16612.1 hypothetical protein BO97DRAFT_383284 [Aspergillus homomorphus CBS 101889]